MARGTNSISVMISKNLTKKGKIKGKNKKETKALKGACNHVRITKKGHMKSAISIIGDYCYCEMCHKKFPARFYSDDQIKETVGNFEELNNQIKFAAATANTGEKSNKYFSQIGTSLVGYKKAAKKVIKVAKRSSDMRKKSKKDKSYNGEQMYGQWKTRRHHD